MPAQIDRSLPEQIAKPAFERAEVRDVLAWLRLLLEPRDAAAAVRVLGRPPIELPQVDLARIVQIARRRRLDVVSALESALQAPQLPPQARERIQRFQELHRWAAAALEREPPEPFAEQLIERLGLRRRQLFATEGQDTEERLAGLDHLVELAREFASSVPNGDARALATRLVALASGDHTPASSASGAPPDPRDDTLERTLALLREEVLGDVARIARRLGELRLDTDLDVSHGIVRYLELIKLAALHEQPSRQGRSDMLADINARLLAATTPLQREIYESSPLDQLLRAGSGEEDTSGPTGSGTANGAALAVLGPRGEPSLDPFLPRRGEGLVLSASDVETYRGCPLRYKFARVLRIPTDQTLAQRFGIVLHQVLERYHSAQGPATGGDSPTDDPPSAQEGALLELLDAAWRRAGLGEAGEERALLMKARAALARYAERLREEPARPLWFERSFAFGMGPHHVRGRVDRVDRLPDGGYELIDYKTGRARSAEELREDIQLSLYAIAAREAWGLDASRQAYYYLLDDRKVPVPRTGDGEEAWVREAVQRVGAGILAQDFEPTPSPAACRLCDYRIVCPAAER